MLVVIGLVGAELHAHKTCAARGTLVMDVRRRASTSVNVAEAEQNIRYLRSYMPTVLKGKKGKLKFCTMNGVKLRPEALVVCQSIQIKFSSRT